ncbi:MAG: maleylpyruvate isomerase family mycothiol-dependent enzyme [Marmoricola sp.]
MSDNAAADLTALLEPLTGLMSEAAAADPTTPTPCSEWDLAHLTTHLAGTTTNFAIAAEGGEPDWSAPPEVGTDAAGAFASAAGRLKAALADGGDEQVANMACAELSVHTWDLARALGRETASLPPGAAERGGAFMRAGLTDAGRGEFFAPEKPAPEGADTYTALAAFAGRDV